MDIIEYELSSFPLFDGIPLKIIPSLLNKIGATERCYSEGEIILAENDDANIFGIILSGRVQVEKYDYSGHRNIFATLSAPEMFSGTFAFSDVKKMSVEIRSIFQSKIILLNAATLTEQSTTEPFYTKMLINMVGILAQKNMLFDRRMEIITKRTTREKLLEYLYTESVIRGTKDFCIPYDRQALSDYLAVDRSGLSVEISALQKEGLIECRKNHFVLKI